MSKTYMVKEKGDATIICVPLVNWARYRKDGYVFVEKNKAGDTPQKQFLDQINAAKGDAPEDDGDDLPTIESKKDEIMAYLDSQNIEYDASANKATLMESVV